MSQRGESGLAWTNSLAINLLAAPSSLERGLLELCDTSILPARLFHGLQDGLALIKEAVQTFSDLKAHSGIVASDYLRAMNSLEEKERQVMALYYLEELNMKEVGAVLGIGESRVSQLHSLALVRLRARLQELMQTHIVPKESSETPVSISP